MERSTAARKARSVFFEHQNTIDIYIEDTALGYKKIFKGLLNRALNSKYLINDVFPLGGRNAVINEWKKDTNKRERPILYIVDGDLHLMNGNLERAEGLYSLPFYCIENILICEHALTQLMVEEDPEREYDELKKLLDFPTWVKDNQPLLNLFVFYAICFKHCPEIKTVSCKLKDFISSDSGVVDELKIQNKINELQGHITHKIGEESFKQEIELYNQVIENHNSLTKFVSAKDYLLPLLFLRIRKNIKTTAQNLNLKYRASLHCDISQISDIDDYILSDKVNT
ncbi:MAG: DUF4435 domain-containing protein [Aeromonas sp.]